MQLTARSSLIHKIHGFLSVIDWVEQIKTSIFSHFGTNRQNITLVDGGSNFCGWWFHFETAPRDHTSGRPVFSRLCRIDAGINAE